MILPVRQGVNVGAAGRDAPPTGPGNPQSQASFGHLWEYSGWLDTLHLKFAVDSVEPDGLSLGAEREPDWNEGCRPWVAAGSDLLPALECSRS